MKKTVLSIIALFVMNMMFSQEISFGVKAGLNYGATLTSDSGYNDLFKPAAKVQFGVFADFDLSESFGLQTGLDYFGSGFQGKGEAVDYTPLGSPIAFPVNNEVKGKLAYLQVPLVGKYYVMENLSIEAGPYVGFLLSAKYDGKSTLTHPLAGDIVTTYDNEDVKDEYNSTDFGLKLGLGYKLESGLLFNLGYNLGLSDIQKELTGEVAGTDGIKGTESFKVKNQFLQFSLGYKFL